MINVFLQLSINSFIHFLVILFVVSGSDIVHPLLVVEIPAYCFFYTLLKL